MLLLDYLEAIFQSNFRPKQFQIRLVFAENSSVQPRPVVPNQPFLVRGTLARFRNNFEAPLVTLYLLKGANFNIWNFFRTPRLRTPALDYIFCTYVLISYALTPTIKRSEKFHRKRKEPDRIVSFCLLKMQRKSLRVSV